MRKTAERSSIAETTEGEGGARVYRGRYKSPPSGPSTYKTTVFRPAWRNAGARSSRQMSSPRPSAWRRGGRQPIRQPEAHLLAGKQFSASHVFCNDGHRGVAPLAVPLAAPGPGPTGAPPGAGGLRRAGALHCAAPARRRRGVMARPRGVNVTPTTARISGQHGGAGGGRQGRAALAARPRRGPRRPGAGPARAAPRRRIHGLHRRRIHGLRRRQPDGLHGHHHRGLHRGERKHAPRRVHDAGQRHGQRPANGVGRRPVLRPAPRARPSR